MLNQRRLLTSLVPDCLTKPAYLYTMVTDDLSSLPPQIYDWEAYPIPQRKEEEEE